MPERRDAEERIFWRFIISSLRVPGVQTEEKNLCTACAFCHDLVHEGKLRVEGEAPHKLTWRDGRGGLL